MRTRTYKINTQVYSGDKCLFGTTDRVFDRFSSRDEGEFNFLADLLMDELMDGSTIKALFSLLVLVSPIKNAGFN